MSPYAQTLAQARLHALQALQQALRDAETPDEKRRCAVAIFNAPDPCDLDDSIEWADANDKSNQEATDAPPSRTQHSEPSTPHFPPVPPAAGAAPAAGACCNLDAQHPAAPALPNSYPAYPELAHLTDDQIHGASQDDLRQLIVAARLQSHHGEPTATASGP